MRTTCYKCCLIDPFLPVPRHRFVVIVSSSSFRRHRFVVIVSSSSFRPPPFVSQIPRQRSPQTVGARISSSPVRLRRVRSKCLGRNGCKNADGSARRAECRLPLGANFLRGAAWPCNHRSPTQLPAGPTVRATRVESSSPCAGLIVGNDNSMRGPREHLLIAAVRAAAIDTGIDSGGSDSHAKLL